MSTILAIETSCDETAAAVVQSAPSGLSVLANVVHSQASLHANWGGVVPDLASREHIKNIAPVINEALERAGITPSELDAIAVTAGPGLMPALVVGVNAAKMLATLWDKPLLPIHHIEGHIYANLLDSNASALQFPLLALVVSGGHTQLVLMQKDFDYTILGHTQDDAVGEAFDKVAKMLNLPYPGGPVIANLADTFREAHPEETLAPLKKLFPRPMLDAHNYNFSFSGLKTAVLYYIQAHQDRVTDPLFQSEVAYAFQEAATDVLVTKTKRALEEFQPKTLVMAGGVAANVTLRNKLALLAESFPELSFRIPPFVYSLDNAAMIGAAAVIRFDRMSEEQRDTLKDSSALEPSATRSLDQSASPC